MPIDYKKYPPNWLTEIRPAILKRADNCCERCGVPNYTIGVRTRWELVSIDEYITDCATLGEKSLHQKYGNWRDKGATKIVLTIAHLDHDPENWNVTTDRLRAWCQRCHLEYDRNHKKILRYESSLFPISGDELSALKQLQIDHSQTITNEGIIHRENQS